MNKKYELKREKRVLGVITAAAVLGNVMFLPPFKREEEFELKVEMSVDDIKQNLYRGKKMLLEKKKGNLVLPKNRNNFKGIPNYYGASEIGRGR